MAADNGVISPLSLRVLHAGDHLVLLNSAEDEDDSAPLVAVIGDELSMGTPPWSATPCRSAACRTTWRPRPDPERGVRGVVVGVMVLAGLIAATGPELRGLRIHPMEALRDE